MDLLAPGGGEAQQGAAVRAFVLQLAFLEFFALPGVGAGERLVELDDEVVAEVLRQRTAAVQGAVADHAALARDDLDVGALVEGVHHDVAGIGLREGEAELGGALGRRDLGGNVGVGQVDAVVIGLRCFRLVREPAGAGVLVEALRAGHRHDGELAVVVHPGRRLVGLLEAADPVGVVGVGPAVAHLAGLRRPEVHAPGDGNRRIGIAVRELGLAHGAHQRVDPFHRVAHLADGLGAGGAGCREEQYCGEADHG